jgi:hypothetical protein
MGRSRLAVIPRGPIKLFSILFNTFKDVHTWAFFLRDGLDGVHEMVGWPNWDKGLAYATTVKYQQATRQFPV